MLATVAAAPVVVSAAATSTDAPGAVVPVTVVVADPTVAPEAGPVSVTVSAPGGPWVTYRAVVTAGVSTVRPWPRPRMSRSSWAWAQVSGEAEPAAWPSVKPIDAVAGSLP